MTPGHDTPGKIRELYRERSWNCAISNMQRCRIYGYVSGATTTTTTHFSLSRPPHDFAFSVLHIIHTSACIGIYTYIVACLWLVVCQGLTPLPPGISSSPRAEKKDVGVVRAVWPFGLISQPKGCITVPCAVIYRFYAN